MRQSAPVSESFVVPKRRSRGPSPLYRLLQHSLMALACPAAVLAQPCNQGLPTGNLTGVLNTYYPGAGGTAVAVAPFTTVGASLLAASVRAVVSAAAL